MSDDRDTPTRWRDRDWMRFCEGTPEPVGGGPIPPTDGGASIPRPQKCLHDLADGLGAGRLGLGKGGDEGVEPG